MVVTELALLAAADDEVLRLAGADVLQGQQRPVLRRAAVADLARLLARLHQRRRLVRAPAGLFDLFVGLFFLSRLLLGLLLELGRGRIVVTLLPKASLVSSFAGQTNEGVASSLGS